jgi:hypothetical protein
MAGNRGSVDCFDTSTPAEAVEKLRKAPAIILLVASVPVEVATTEGSLAFGKVNETDSGGFRLGMVGGSSQSCCCRGSVGDSDSKLGNRAGAVP